MKYAGRQVRPRAVAALWPGRLALWPGLLTRPLGLTEGLRSHVRPGETVLYLESATFVTGEAPHIDGRAHAPRW
jgi:hypothetical protein